MALATIGDADVLRAEVHLLDRGCWWAEAILDTKTAPSGSVTFKANGGMSLTGTVYMAGVFLDSAHIRIAGGAAGMGKTVPAKAYENSKVSDPLNTIVNASGDSLSSNIDSSILSARLSIWTQTKKLAAQALDELVSGAETVLAKSLTWRFLDDGKLWIGEETWPAATLADGDDVLRFDPAAGLYEIGVTTPSLLPGVNLDTVGKVAAVDHYITHDKVRSLAWVA